MSNTLKTFGLLLVFFISHFNSIFKNWFSFKLLSVTEIIPKCLYLGEYPLFHRDFLVLKQIGVTTIINCCLEKKHNPSVLKYYKIKGIHFSIMDYTEPNTSLFFKAIDTIYEQIKKKEVLYIHCKAGKGRSACLVLGTLIYKFNIEKSRAFVFLKQIRPEVSDTIYNYNCFDEGIVHNKRKLKRVTNVSKIT